MFRPVNCLLPALILVLGLTMAWTGRARLQGNSPSNQEVISQVRLCDEALVLEIRQLRRDMDELKKNLQKKGAEDAKPANVFTLVKDAQPGKIVHIDSGDETVVEVNLGKDAGMEKHCTLDIYRQGMPPEYLGMLSIFEVNDQSCFCRVVSTNPIKNQPIRVGDQVRR